MKYLVIGLLLFSVVSCSQTTKKKYKSSILNASTYKNDAKRSPASPGSIPGYDSFIEAIKASKSYFQVPLGYEVELLFIDMRDSPKPKTLKTVYLKQTTTGIFSIDNDPGNTEMELEGHDVDTPASLIEEIDKAKQSGIIKSITKLSSDKYSMRIVLNEDHICDVSYDLNSYKSMEPRCEDSKESLIWESKFISKKKVDLGQYENMLRKTSIRLFSNIVKDDDGSMQGIKGEREDDWWEFLFNQPAK